MHILNLPNEEQFKKFLRQNMSMNCPATAEDADIARNSFGPDVSCLKGKSTRPCPPTVCDNKVEIPRELAAKRHKT